MNFCKYFKKISHFFGSFRLTNPCTIAVFGLGKVGSAISAVALENRFRVFGFDINRSLLKSMESGDFITQEPYINSILKKHGKYFKTSIDLNSVISQCRISIIIVPTPSIDDGNFSSKSVELAVSNIIRAINFQMAHSKQKLQNFRHSIIVASTVSPGTMRTKILPLLKKLHTDLVDKVELVYSPEFIALGSIVHNLRNPEYIILGHEGSGVSKEVIKYKRKINTNQAPIHITSFESAEIAKISVNTFLTTKISYANMLSRLINETPSASQSEVFNVLKDDSRIGKKFFSPGLGYGGPCLPRDNRALIAFGKSKNVSVPIANATDEINSSQPSYIANQLKSFLKNKTKILILGVTYKAGTNSIEESHATRVIKLLDIKPENLSIHDFYFEFKEDSYWNSFKTFSTKIPEEDFDGFICFVNDFRYINFLEEQDSKRVYKAYDLAL